MLDSPPADVAAGLGIAANAPGRELPKRNRLRDEPQLTTGAALPQVP